MKLKKAQLVNILIVLAVILYLFTPLGFHIKVYVNRLFSFNPTPVEERKQRVLASYDWKLLDIEGNTVNLKKQKGKVVLLNFWATWCPSCVAEMPDFQKLYTDYGDSIAFLFIARDEKKKVIKFMDRKKYDFPVYFESGFTPKILYSKSIPTTYIIDKKGKIIMAKTGVADWNSDETRALLDKLISEQLMSFSLL